MTTFSVSLLTLSFLSGVICQMTMKELAPGVVKPSETLHLTCQVSGFSITDSRKLWGIMGFRQCPGKGLEFLAAVDYNGGIYRSSALQSRLTASRDTVKNEVYVQLSAVKPEDTAVYYCARNGMAHYYAFDIWGPGTMVTITSAEQSFPKLFPLISCGECQDPVVIGCLAKGFLPDSVTFDWTDSNNKNWTNGYRRYPSVYSTGTYTTSSQITVPKSEGSSKESYFCQASHPALGQPKKIEVSPCSEPIIKIPIISIHPPLRSDWSSNKNKGLVICVAQDFSPKDISVKFLKDGKAVPTENTTNSLEQDGQDGFRLVSTLEITKIEWDRDTKFTCVVDHPASETHESRNVSASSVDECTNPSGLEVIPLRPSFENIFDIKEAKLTCLVDKMQSPEGLNITWYKKDHGKEVELKTVQSEAEYKADGYSATGIATVCATEWNADGEFICKVAHPELATTRIVTMRKGNGEKPSPPSVYVFPPSTEELNLKETVTLTCLVKQCNPPDLFVKWLEGGREMGKGSYINTEPMRETTSTENHTYFMYSKLTIEEKSWNSGKTYSCVVGHELLPIQIIQKTIDKTSGKPTSVNVSLVMSEATSACY